MFQRVGADQGKGVLLAWVCIFALSFAFRQPRKKHQWMRIPVFSFLLWMVAVPLESQRLQSPFEANNNYTGRYDEIMAYYRELAQKHSLVKLVEAGPSDVSSFPLNTVILSGRKQFTPEKVRKAGKAVLMINGGIHPGEADGIEAAMLFARDLVTDPRLVALLDRIAVVIIPVYNVGGSLLRNSTTRVNQNGPEVYGFRGNAQYLDLNRDFIKCDSRNALSFSELFRYWDPDVLLETHTTDGADFPYVLTLIASQRHKLQTELGNYFYKRLLPQLYRTVSEQRIEMIPYVHSAGDPATGIYDFMDFPRYSTGYAALFHCMGIMAESHMLKPFAARVSAQRLLMTKLSEALAGQASDVIAVRAEARQAAIQKKVHDIRWQIDTSFADSLLYTGYELGRKISSVTGFERYYFDHSKPYTKRIPYYNTCRPVSSVEVPECYVVPGAYGDVIERLRANGIRMRRLGRDSLIEAEFYRIGDLRSAAKPYEGHFPHRNFSLERVKTHRQYFKGDYLIPVRQDAIRYVVETLEPDAHDSFFRWNFFDAILERKEYFSDFLFEEIAGSILDNDPVLKADFQDRRTKDPAFASNPHAMLEFIYSRSKYAEPGYMLYPVARCFPPD